MIKRIVLKNKISKKPFFFFFLNFNHIGFLKKKNDNNHAKKFSFSRKYFFFPDQMSFFFKIDKTTYFYRNVLCQFMKYRRIIKIESVKNSTPFFYIWWFLNLLIVIIYQTNWTKVKVKIFKIQFLFMRSINVPAIDF